MGRSWEFWEGWFWGAMLVIQGNLLAMEWPNIQFRYGKWKYGEDFFMDALNLNDGNYKKAFAAAKECRDAHLAGDCDLCGRE